MLIACFGPPSAFTQFGLHVFRVVTNTVLKNVDYIVAPSLERLREAWQQRQHPHVFYFSDLPDSPVIDLFTRTDGPTLTFFEDPADITGFIARERGKDWFWSVRLTNQCLVAIEDIFKRPKNLVIRRSDDLTILQFVEIVSEQFGIEVSEEQRRSILQRVTESKEPAPDTTMESVLMSKWVHARPIGQGMLDAPDDILQILDSLHRQILTHVGQGTVTSFPWFREMLIPGGQPKEVLPPEIDLTGPARCLFYGPYLNLPKGDWELALNFDVDDNFSGNRIEVDILHVEVVRAESFVLPVRGELEIIAKFKVIDPKAPIQVRMNLMEGAIEGRLRVKSVEVRPWRKSSTIEQFHSLVTSG